MLKLSLLHSSCKVSLIFKSNLELSLSFFWKNKENYKSQSILWWSVDFKNMRIYLILFDKFFNPSFKMMASFLNVARTTTSTSKFI